MILGLHFLFCEIQITISIFGMTCLSKYKYIFTELFYVYQHQHHIRDNHFSYSVGLDRITETLMRLYEFLFQGI